MRLRDIKIGTTIDIRFQQTAAKEEKTGNTGDTYRSDVFDILSDYEFEMQIPLHKEKPILLPEGVRYEIVFITGSGMFRTIGVIRGKYKKENFNVYKMEIKHADLEKFQRREYFRFSCSIPLIFSVLEEEEAELDTIEGIMGTQDTATENIRGMGTILDISGGGIRFSTNMDLSDYKFLLLQFDLTQEGREPEKLELVAFMIACERPDANSKYVCRVRIMFKNTDYQEKIIKYIFEEERRIRRRGQE
ncbi:MAG: flagellar brake protein [Lachnospiraceae bacterium]|nr:flagellar brake protein [Lachnospiraceae bacterium]